MIVGGRVPEVHEARVVQGGGRLKAGNVATQLTGFLVGTQHNRGGIPTHERADAVFDRLIAWMRSLAIGCDRIHIRGVGRVWERCAAAASLTENLLQDEVGPLRTLELEHAVERVTPLLRLERIRVT